MGSQRNPQNWERRQRKWGERRREKESRKSFFSRASQAATALHSWAVEISHKADACISSACLTRHISNSWLTAVICQKTGVYVCECAVFLLYARLGLNVCGIRKVSKTKGNVFEKVTVWLLPLLSLCDWKWGRCINHVRLCEPGKHSRFSRR